MYLYVTLLHVHLSFLRGCLIQKKLEWGCGDVESVTAKLQCIPVIFTWEWSWAVCERMSAVFSPITSLPSEK